MTTKTAAQRGTAVSVKSLAITAICLVLVYVFTAVVNIRLPFAPNGGLIHLGNVPLFVAAILFGKRTDPPWKCTVIHRCHFIRKENRSHCRWDRNGAL